MAQTNIIARERRTLVGLESTFGTTPASTFPNAMTEIVLMHDEMLVDGLAVEMLDNMDARVRRNDALAPVQGLQIATKFAAKSYLKAIPTAAVLTGAGSVTALSHRILFTHMLGAEHAALGTTVASGASATTFDAASAATLKKGTWILVDGEPTKITNIATDTITVSPALSGTPSNGDVVRNLYNYAPAESHSSSLTWQAAWAGLAAAQYTLNGAHGGFKLALAFGQLATVSLDFTAVKFTGPSDQSIAVTSVTDDMSAPFVMKDASVILSSTTPIRSTLLVCESIELDMPNQWQMVRDPGGVQTVAAVVNTAGRPRAGSLKVRLRMDTDQTTAFAAGTAYPMFAAWIPYGSGVTQRWFIVEMANATIVNQPKAVKHGNDLFYLDLELAPRMDTSVTAAAETGTDLDFIRAPFRIAFG